MVVSKDIIERGTMAWRRSIVLMDIFYKEHEAHPLSSEFVSVHVLTEAVEVIMHGELVAQHGYVEHLSAREKISRFELPETLEKKGYEVTVIFNKESITPRLGYFKILPHSWLLHKESGIIVDLIPPGAEFGVDYPTRRVPHPHRPPYTASPGFELLRGKLPTQEQVKQVVDRFEAWGHSKANETLCTAVF